MKTIKESKDAFLSKMKSVRKMVQFLKVLTLGNDGGGKCNARLVSFVRENEEPEHYSLLLMYTKDTEKECILCVFPGKDECIGMDVSLDDEENFLTALGDLYDRFETSYENVGIQYYCHYLGD